MVAPMQDVSINQVSTSINGNNSYDDQHHESQHTVVTETHGVLSGQRMS